MDSKYQRLRLLLAYDGTDYLGWQKQTSTDQTIQTALEKALFLLTRREISTTGSGRTDAGVHARGQVVHFDFEGNPQAFDWVRGLNRYLPQEIRVQNVRFAPIEFHATRSAQSKTYKYQIQWGPAEDPLLSRFSHCVPSPLDCDHMNELSAVFLGEHDFASFQTQGTELATTVRTLSNFNWRLQGPNFVVVTLSGSGFLKQMVRNLLGTLLHGYWEKRLNSNDLRKILSGCDRQLAHGTAPARGLCLDSVEYPENLDKQCVKF